MRLANAVAAVTGASSGIGRALAVALARSGCRLLLTALEEPELASLAAELSARHGRPVAFRAADVTDPAAREGVLDWIRAQPDPPSLLVSNAGGGAFRRFTAAPWSQLRRTMALNVEAPTHLVHGLMPLLRAQPQAKVVLISSGISRLPYPGLAVYGASKGYLSSLGESLACELRGSRVSVLTFHPGFTRTGFMAAAGMDMSRVPDFMLASPEHVAAKIVRAIEHDRIWSYSDFAARAGALLGALLPAKVRVRIMRNLFWMLPDE